jgi:hypothetical protein
MNEIAVVDKRADWRRLKSLVLDSVSSPITKRPGIAERETGPPAGHCADFSHLPSHVIVL